MSLKRLLIVFIKTGCLILFILCIFLSTALAAVEQKVIILGFDGMDPIFTQKMIDNNQLPNFKKLKDVGDFKPLTSSIPPQSPVAWANFITGLDSGGHNIFDFIARHPENYLPYLSSAEMEKPKKVIGLSLSKPKYKQYRMGKTFWEILSEHKISSVAIRPPSNFPPATGGGISSSGMGTPDILGGYGTYHFFTTDEITMKSENGGIAYPVEIKNNVIHTSISGPTIKDGEKAKIPFTIYIDTRNQMAKIIIQKNEILLPKGKWSDWIRLEFKMGTFTKAKSICRFYMKNINPEFELYVTPLNIDPYNAPYPISYPENYAEKVAEKIGLYYTQGMPEDSKALMNERLTNDEYLAQSQIPTIERKKMFDLELNRFKKGLLYCYFSVTDAFQHMFMRTLDKDHPGYNEAEAAKYAHVIPDIYIEMDKILGETMSKIDDKTTLICVSDHGFGPFRWGVNLNTWLHREGYMKFIREFRGTSGEFFENVDWKETKAYAIGLNSLYINLKDREGQGIVPVSEKESLIKEIKTKLLNYKDINTGNMVFASVDIPTVCYSGEYTKNSPDMIIGYNKYYRASWGTALGAAPKKIIEENLSKWSGDHCISRDVVPGIIFANKKIKTKNPALIDIAPTVLNLFNIKSPKDMKGNVLF